MMRFLILVSAFFILANAVLFLLPTDVETSNLKYESSPELNESEIRFLARESSLSESLEINFDVQDDSEKEGDLVSSTNKQSESVSDDMQIPVAQEPKQENVAQTQRIQDQSDASLVNPSDEKQSTDDSEEQQASVNEQIVTNVPIISECYRIGPFLREARMKASSNQIVSIEFKIIEREATEVFATRVYIGPFEEQSEALKTRKELTNSGVNDHFHRREQNGSYIVSLGIYSNNASAIRQKAKFQSLDFAAETRNEKTRLPKNYWIELPGNITQENIDSLRTISWGESSVSLGKHPCQTQDS